MKAGLLALGCCFCCAALLAQDDPLQGLPSVSAEYQRLQQQRTALTQAMDEREAVCAERFAVNDCLDKVRLQRRTEMADLRRQEALLHDSERIQRSQQELRRQDLRAQEHAASTRSSDAVQSSAVAQDAQAPQAPQAQSVNVPEFRRDSVPARRSSAPEPEALEQNRAAYQRKQEAAQQRKADLARRLEEERRKQVQPLPANGQ